MSGPRPPLASSFTAAAAAAQNPSAAAPSPPRARRAREEGEVSSGADDDEVLLTHTAAASNAHKFVEAGAQVPPPTLLGKGSNTFSVSNVMAHKSAGPSYKKTMRVNQGQFKPGTNRNLTWQKPVASDNLVITFSDDDSGADSEKTKQDRVRETKASSQGSQKTGNSIQTRTMKHTVTTEPSGQIQHGDAMRNLPFKIHHKVTEGAGDHETDNLRGRLAAAPFTNGQSIPEDTSTLVPITSSQVRQRVPPVGTSTVSNRRLHMEPGEETVGPLNYSGQIVVESRNSRLFSLLEMEELQERELEAAQEHRRKCEVEERKALRAYRRAQRALIEANERCAILRQKRETSSAQVHGLIAENSSFIQSLSTQNAGEGLTMPSLVSSHIHADSQMLQNQGGRYNLYPDEPPQQPVDKHEARPHSRDDLATNAADPNFVSAANDNSAPSDYMEDYLLPARQSRSECALAVENHMDETIQVYAQENRQISGDSAQDYELLEASLRSRLVERFGKKSCLNSTRESNEEPAVGKVAETEHDKQPAHIGLQLQEAEKNLMITVEGTLELGSDGADCTEKTGDLSNLSSGPSMGNCDAEDNISSFRELCIPSSMNVPCFPSSAPHNAARHIKWAFPGFCKESSHEENDCLTNDASSEATEHVQYMILDCVRENVNMLSATQADSDMAHSGIDPFWPFCMFELRGKCNDEECQWQHAEQHPWRKSKHTKHALTSASGRIPYGFFQHILPVPAYRVGSNLIKADLNLTQLVMVGSQILTATDNY
ncbi:hypothetical protein QOZ80_5BG0442590 [Eleusine coracana subsp. coracana]|nr:hypothetical protein QOZ80_5BG0442590 [Eleusine coracana subsp. coracana]